MAGVLRRAYRDGLLSVDTMESRLAAAYSAKLAGELDSTACDLPSRRVLDRLWRRARSIWESGMRSPELKLVVPRMGPGGRLLVGRSSQCDLRIVEGSVSRTHAELRLAARGWMIRDLTSTNGTFVNGRRIQRALVGTRDEVWFGNVPVRFLSRPD
jgi:hypothetical protein